MSTHVHDDNLYRCVTPSNTEQGYQAQAPVVKRFKTEVMIRLDHNPLNVEPPQFDQDKLSLWLRLGIRRIAERKMKVTEWTAPETRVGTADMSVNIHKD